MDEDDQVNQASASATGNRWQRPSLMKLTVFGYGGNTPTKKEVPQKC
jgi:hypothetical protein